RVLFRSADSPAASFSRNHCSLGFSTPFSTASVKLRRTQHEHVSSGLPLIAVIRSQRRVSMDEVRLSTRNNVISLGERSAVPKNCPIKLPTSWQLSCKRGYSWQYKT